MRGPERPYGRDGAWARQGSRRPTDPPPPPRTDLGVARQNAGGTSAPQPLARPAPATEAPQRRHLDLGPNALGAIAAIGIFAIVGVMFQYRATASITPAPSIAVVSPTATPSGSPSPSASPAPTPLAVAELAFTGAVDLPETPSAPTPGFPASLGSNLYLLGPHGIIVVNATDPTNPQPVTFKAKSPANLHRLLAFGGVWVSGWTGNPTTCDSACWSKATTYLLDPTSGEIRATLAGRYLVGSDGSSVWTVGGGKLEAFDPNSGQALFSVAYKSTAELRAGCGYLWSFEKTASGWRLRQLDSSGAALSESVLTNQMDVGPVEVAGGCWGISRLPGARSAMVELSPTNTGVDLEKQFGGVVSYLGGELWALNADGLVQRFDPLRQGLGRKFRLPAGVTGDGKLDLFGDAGQLWHISGIRLQTMPIPGVDG